MSSVSRNRCPVRFLPVLAGVCLFLCGQYAVSLWRLGHQTGGMANKFSALAREEYVGFLVLQNLQVLPAYLLLALAGSLLLQPVVDGWTRRSRFQGIGGVVLRSAVAAALLHGFFMLRLADTRPYFLSDAEFGHWYYRMLEVIPQGLKPAAHLVLFKIVPWLGVAAAAVWHLRRLWEGLRPAARMWAGGSAAGAGLLFAAASLMPAAPETETGSSRPPNILIIGSDSLRADRLGAYGYRPARRDGPAAGGVSPVIDALAARSLRFENCYTPIASTLESGTTVMSSSYPHTHGIRQMFPDRETVAAAQAATVPLAGLLRERGYDTAAIGDWCASYYQLMPLGFETISVSNFDNFKIYMSQAVVMSHFVIPLYFDHVLGYRLFPQLGSFAQFVTPQVVTHRVEKRLEQVARERRPFFWHVFYSCNHLKYRSPEPYSSMFGDPQYQGVNRNEVKLDIDAFIRGTALEAKAEALPPEEVAQIRALYDGCTRNFDDQVGKILAALQRQGLAEHTIVVITSDHGDDLYEPGVTFGHGLTFNGGLQANRIPLIVHVPGVAPRVIPESVRTLDVAPTLAELAGVETPEVWEGESFAGWIGERETPEWRPFYGETGFPFIQFGVPGAVRPKLPAMDELTVIDESFNYQFVLKKEYSDQLVQAKQRCLRTRHWKLVCTPTADGGRHFALFNLTADPYGERDLAAERPEVLAAMRPALERWMDHHRETPVAAIFPQGEPL